ncbi:hypothetical protein WAE61_01510 [Comamonadaceae bacterium PP-2]
MWQQLLPKQTADHSSFRLDPLEVTNFNQNTFQDVSKFFEEVIEVCLFSGLFAFECGPIFAMSRCVDRGRWPGKNA